MALGEFHEIHHLLKHEEFQKNIGKACEYPHHNRSGISNKIFLRNILLPFKIFIDNASRHFYISCNVLLYCSGLR